MHNHSNGENLRQVDVIKPGKDNGAEKKQMTHEELLAICDNYSFKDSAEPVKALRAVVELPIEDNSKPDSFIMNFANRSPNEIAAQCFQWGYATAMNKVIQAIKKELK